MDCPNTTQISNRMSLFLASVASVVVSFFVPLATLLLLPLPLLLLPLLLPLFPFLPSPSIEPISFPTPTNGCTRADWRSPRATVTNPRLPTPLPAFLFPLFPLFSLFFHFSHFLLFPHRLSFFAPPPFFCVSTVAPDPPPTKSDFFSPLTRPPTRKRPRERRSNAWFVWRNEVAVCTDGPIGATNEI